MRKAALVAAVMALAAIATAITAPGSQASVDPSNFVRHVTNRWYPLKPGTVLVYKGVKDGQRQTDRFATTHDTKKIEGVRCTVVHDVSTHQGRLLEETYDYYAQDKQGNVWYFGEDTKAYENGHVSTEGSWQAGVNGAAPGVIMEAHPKISDGYRQEYYKGHAEDQAWIVQYFKSLHVPYGRVGPILKSLEFTRLEPKVIDEKDYAKGIGIVREISRTGALETAYLAHVHRP
jgi:hypothetical protein